jgi:hypothetical protein
MWLYFVLFLQLTGVELGEIRPQAAWGSPGMTLATILSICLFCSVGTGRMILASLSAVSGLVRPVWPQVASHEPQRPASAQNQDAPSSSQSAPASPTPTPSVSSSAQVSSGQEKTKPTRGKRRNRKKTKAPDASPDPSANCTPVAAGSTAATGATSTASAPTPSTPANGAAANGTSAPPNCPPEKKIVHDGGTSEPPIELVGGPGGAQASHQRDTTDQLLGSVENNLKKVAGRQLNSSQQEMMTQIQQFIEQSRAAVAAGDMERGHNLAMKAHLLSAELVKP